MADISPIATLDQLGRGPVVAVHVNVGHLALCVLDCCGNPLGIPDTVSLALDGLPALTRDARARDTMSQVLALADVYCAGAVVIEDLDFAEQRTGGPRRIAVRYSRRSPRENVAFILRLPENPAWVHRRTHDELPPSFS
jgi:hypothetical protein